jgi:2-keto-4-pentenoate hydratase/2-oxohepta-3-ene-1,7-dioic acid hydratase in catechol pathway
LQDDPLRLVTCRIHGQPCAAALVGASGDERIVDRLAADSELPSDVLGLVQGGPALLDRARNAVERASAAADPSVVRSLTDVTLLAPIPRPPKIVCIGVNDVELA